MMNYVEMKDGSYRVANSRVSLDSIVYEFWSGAAAEAIAQNFPALTLEQVYGAIAFYLAHQAEVDAYLKQGEQDYEAMRAQARDADPMFYQKLVDAKRHDDSLSGRCGFEAGDNCGDAATRTAC